MQVYVYVCVGGVSCLISWVPLTMIGLRNYKKSDDLTLVIPKHPYVYAYIGVIFVSFQKESP